ncbi:UNVERIFIED_CONTAM: hypothetical protein FKN15_052970 [Acipenser sinensis]
MKNAIDICSTKIFLGNGKSPINISINTVKTHSSYCRVGRMLDGQTAPVYEL